ncbi:hypothetical protein U6G28_04085 [Actinomycetaceae bacterium MB13-C1-2]|nr:hypothetical protein U6G28_04085 [Actinomycetaceae bacterium MB13-C1-2]
MTGSPMTPIRQYGTPADSTPAGNATPAVQKLARQITGMDVNFGDPIWPVPVLIDLPHVIDFPGRDLPAGDTRHDSGMTIKIAISLPDEQVEAIRRQVELGLAPSVSGFISEVLRKTEREDTLTALLADLDSEHGPLTPEQVAWGEEQMESICRED